MKKKSLQQTTNNDNGHRDYSSNNIIDDPDELLYSVSIRELNKHNPDPRWASILISCRKEKIKLKDEVIEQLQKLPTNNLVEILKKQSGRSSQQE